MPWIHGLKGCSGIYFIRDRASGTLLYIGESHTGRLKKTLIRHFQQWTERRWSWRHSHVTYGRLDVEVRILLTLPNEAADAQYKFIQELRPRDNQFDGHTLEGDVPF